MRPAWSSTIFCSSRKKWWPTLALAAPPSPTKAATSSRAPKSTCRPFFPALQGEFFTLHVRRLLGARRTLEVTSRLSMVNKPPALLHPAQRICHRDSMVGARRVDPDAGEGIAASVL
jgi:hypothetical protein